MADIDMIPRSYRDGVRLRHALRRTGAALAVVVLCAGAGNAALRWSTASIERQSAALRAAASAAQSDLARAAGAYEAQLRQQRQAALLRTLRREHELAMLAQALDGALPERAWLTGVTLRRGLAPSAATDTADATDAAGAGPDLPDTAVELAGQAAGYEEVTDFLARLARMPGVQRVALQSSGANAADGAIDFQAALTLAAPSSSPEPQP